MPLYELKCKHCSYEFEAVSTIKKRKGVVCVECGGRTEIQMSPPRKDWFRPGYFESMDMHITSKQHLKEVCLKHNVSSRALGDVRNITEI